MKASWEQRHGKGHEFEQLHGYGVRQRGIHQEMAHEVRGGRKRLGFGRPADPFRQHRDRKVKTADDRYAGDDELACPRHLFERQYDRDESQRKRHEGDHADHRNGDRQEGGRGKRKPEDHGGQYEREDAAQERVEQREQHRAEDSVDRAMGAYEEALDRAGDQFLTHAHGHQAQ